MAEEKSLLEEIDKLLDAKLEPINERLEQLEIDVRAIRIQQENDISPRIRGLYEGYSGQREISIELRKNLHTLEHRVEILKDDVSALKMKV